MRLSQAAVKNLFPTAILAKLFGANQKKTVKLDKTSKNVIANFACFLACLTNV